MTEASEPSDSRARPEAAATPLLEEPATCWRRARAGRAAVLVDGAAYFQALRAALLKARRSVFIVGWDIDSRTPLVGAEGYAEDGAPEQLGELLTALVQRRPDLRIHLLLWDYSMLYMLEREPLPALNLNWSTPPQISVCLDDVLPIGASHHQKIVVVDDALAFCGGLDLTVCRWDTSAHALDDRRRMDPGGRPYRPFHDVQMMVDGEAAMALAELVRRRWEAAACEQPLPAEARGDPWPEDLEPDLTDVEVGVTLTRPAYDRESEVRQVEALYLRSIQAAQRSIYIENQFLACDSVSEALARRLWENPRLEVLIVAPRVHHGWLEHQSMDAGRLRFMERFREAGVGDRVSLVYPSLDEAEAGEGVMVHAKLMIVDDRILRVGSANLNNRSMGMDTECDLALVAGRDDQRRATLGVRNRLLAEHLDVEPAALEQALEERGSLLEAVAALSMGARSLKPIELSEASRGDLARAVSQIADPERPIETPSFVGDLFGGRPTGRRLSRTLQLGLAALAVFALVAAWRYTPLSALTDLESLMRSLRGLGDQMPMPLVMPLVYILGGFAAFPVTVLIAVTGMLFSPPVAVAYALAGSLLSAGLTYLIGQLAGRGPLRGLLGPRVNRISRAVARRGVMSVAVLRLMPIAPFTLINLVAGASRVGFRDFMLGTFAGMLPGILAMILLGAQLGRVFTDPRPEEMLILVLCLGGWLLLTLALQALASRLSPERDG